MNGFLRQSTASQARSIGPFVDDTDFKTAETGLTIANTDIKLVANGGASADKNSGGGTHRTNGNYGVTFDATDTATVGELEVSVKVAGALQVFKTFVVLEEAVYDALFVASALGYVANAPVNVAQFGGSNGTFSSGRPEVNTTHAAGTAWGSGAITAASIASGAFTAAKFAAGAFDAVWSVAARILTAATNITSTGGTTVPQTGDSYARIGAPAGASLAADVAAAKVDTAAILDDTGTSGVVVAAASKTGYALSAAGVQVIWDALTAALTTANSIGKLLVDNINATISSRASQTSLDTVDDFLDTEVAAILAAVDTEVAAIKAVTDLLPNAGALTSLATQASVNTIDDFLDTEIADILTDTGTTIDDLVDDLEGRLTAALATALAAHSLGVGRGVADAGSSTTALVIKTVNGGAGDATNDHYNGRHVIFTSGALLLQAASITDYVGATKTLTISAVTDTPADNDTFIIV